MERKTCPPAEIDGQGLALALDTTAEAARVYADACSSTSGSARVERSIEMADEVKQITLAGIRFRNPHFTDDEVHREWMRLLHGDALTELLT